MPDGNNSLYLLQFFDPTGIGALQTDLKTFRTEVRRGQPFDDAGGDGIMSRRGALGATLRPFCARAAAPSIRAGTAPPRPLW
jgi:hypothetical protein